MKTLATLLIAICMFVGNAFGQAQTSFVKTIALDNNTPIFALAGEVIVTESNEDVIRINATINLTNSTETVLQRLFTLGRYNLEVKSANGQLSVSAPKMANHVAIQGVDLLEMVRYEISVPRGTKYELQHTFHSNVLMPSI